MGKVPAASTIAAHNTALNYVFRKALSLNYIQYMPRLISNDGDSTKKRQTNLLCSMTLVLCRCYGKRRTLESINFERDSG